MPAPASFVDTVLQRETLPSIERPPIANNFNSPTRVSEREAFCSYFRACSKPAPSGNEFYRVCTIWPGLALAVVVKLALATEKRPPW